jgi:hypothetical protein
MEAIVGSDYPGMVDLVARERIGEMIIALIANSPAAVKEAAGLVLIRLVSLALGAEEVFKQLLDAGCVTALFSLLESETFADAIGALRAVYSILHHIEKVGDTTEFCAHIASINGIDILEEFAMKNDWNGERVARTALLASELKASLETSS